MKLSALGSAAMGAAGGSISIDGVIPSALSGVVGGEPRWLSTTLIVFQDGAVLKTYDTGTHAVTQVSASGENRLAAGNGVWCASLNPSPGTRSSLAGFGPFPLATLGDMDATGQIGLIISYATQAGIQVYSAAGVGLWELPDSITAGTDLALRSNLTTFSNSAGWHVWQNSPPVLQSFTNRTDTIFQCVPVVVGSAIYVAEASNVGARSCTIRNKDAQTGYVVTTTDAFNIDVMLLSAGVVRIGWSVGAGEAPTDLRLMDLTLANGANRTGVGTGSGITWTTNANLTAVSLPGTPTDGSSASVAPPLSAPIVDKSGRPTTTMASWMNDSSRGVNAALTTTVPTPSVPGGAIAPGGAFYLLSESNTALANARVVEDSTTIAHDFSVANVAKASVIPQGGDKAIQFDDGGALAGDPNLTWDKATQQLRAISPTPLTDSTIVAQATNGGTGAVAVNAWTEAYQEVALGYEVVAGVNVARSTNPALLWHDSAGDEVALSLYEAETPGSPMTFAKNTDLIVGSGAVTVGRFSATGAVPGADTGATRNAGGSGAASTLSGQQRSGTDWFIWQDATGAMRYGPARPTEDDSVSDTSGSLFGNSSATYLTATNETASLPNARQAMAGTNITLDTSTPGQIVINAAGGGSWIPLVDGSEPPAFITDGSGRLITVAYA